MIIKSDIDAILGHIKAKSSSDLFLEIAGNLHAIMEERIKEDKFHNLDVMICSSDHVVNQDVVERMKAQLKDITMDSVDLLYIIGLNAEGKGVEVLNVLALFGLEDKYVSVREVQHE